MAENSNEPLTSTRTMSGGTDTYVLYGPPGVGGTTAAILADPSALAFGAEQDMRNIYKQYQIPRRLASDATAGSWKGRTLWTIFDLEAAVNILRKRKADGKQTLCGVFVDDFTLMAQRTMDQMQQWAVEDAGGLGAPYTTRDGKPLASVMFRTLTEKVHKLVDDFKDLGINLILRCHEREPGMGKDINTQEATFYPGGPMFPSRKMGWTIQRRLSTIIRCGMMSEFADPLSPPGLPFTSVMMRYPPSAEWSTRDRGDALLNVAPLSLAAIMLEHGTFPVIPEREWFIEKSFAARDLTLALGAGYMDFAERSKVAKSFAAGSNLAPHDARATWQTGSALAVMRMVREGVIPPVNLSAAQNK
jgi:hypothetical protein